MLKIGISACFFHADPERLVFKGKTLQYVEQEMAHWVMQKDTMALMIPSPDGDSRRSGSSVTVGDYARELDGLVLMGGSDVSPGSYNEKPLKPEWAGDRIRDAYEIALLRDLVSVADPVPGPFGLARLFVVAPRADVRAAHQHQAIQLTGVIADGDAAAGAARVAVGRRDHQCHRVLLHHPVRHLLLDVLQRLALEDKPLGVGVEEAGGDADFQHAIRSPRRRSVRSPRACTGGDWSGGRCR